MSLKLGKGLLLFGTLLMGTALSASCEDPSIVEPGTTADGGTTRPGIANLTSIKVLPESLSLTVNGTPQTQMFTARGTFLDGHQEDVTDRVAWSTSPTSLGGFSQGSILTLGAYGGEGLVIASSGNVQGSAKIRLRVSRRVVEMDARGADETKFGGKPDAKNPKLVYPYDKVMLPPNLGSIEVHWVRGNQAHTIYEVSLQNQVTDLKVYTGCRVPPGGDANGCVYALSQEIWGLLAYSNLGNRDAVVLTVRSTDGKTVGSADPANLKFANEDMKGGIYYWTAAENGQSVISRIDLEKGKVETYYATADSPTDHNGKKDCVGCHANRPRRPPDGPDPGRGRTSPIWWSWTSRSGSRSSPRSTPRAAPRSSASSPTSWPTVRTGKRWSRRCAASCA